MGHQEQQQQQLRLFTQKYKWSKIPTSIFPILLMGELEVTKAAAAPCREQHKDSTNPQIQKFQIHSINNPKSPNAYVCFTEVP